MSLRLRGVELQLADFPLVVEDLECAARVTGLFGPSGAGKTSLLELVAGLRTPRSAEVSIDGDVLTDTQRGVQVPARRRRLGYVPQDLALFPHLSARRNVEYGRRRGADPKGALSLDHVVEVLEIADLLDRSVRELSGGERQRIALARALVAAPRLLLLDEPLASLDRRLKERVRPYLKRVRDEFGVPMLYVTHDRDEALELCEDVVCLEEGRVVAFGPAAAVLR